MSTEDYQKYLQMMNQWLILKQEDKGLERYFLSRNYEKIGIYGVSVYGRHLIRELDASPIKVLYGIDQKEMESYKGITIYHLSEKLPAVDIIVNTVLQEHNSIKLQLEKIFSCPIVSLEDVVFESYE